MNRTKNTMGLFSFCVLNTVSTLALVWVYNLCFFQDTSFMTREDAKDLFYYITFMFVSTGVLFSMDTKRNFISLFTNVALPFEVISVILFFNELKYVGLLSALITLAWSVNCAVKIIKKQIKTENPKHRKRIKVNRFKYWFNYSRFALSFTSLIIIFSLIIVVVVVPFILTVFNGPAVVPSENNKYEWSIENKYDELSVFKQEVWEEASLLEKVKAMQIVCNIESVHLDLSKKLPLHIKNLSRGALGMYDNEKNTVTICCLDDYLGEEVLVALLHECRHAWQHEEVEKFDSLSTEEQTNPIYDDVKIYKEEFENYSEIAAERYSKMLVENDCEKYSFARAEEYIKIINNVEKGND